MPTLRLNGDARGAIKANLDMAKAIDKAGKTAGKAEVRLNAMDRAARAIKEANDPLQRYNRKLADTARLAVKGKISIADANAVAQRLNRTLNRTGKSGKAAFGAIGGQIKGTLAGLVSVTAAVALVRAEFEKQKEFEDSRTQSQLTVAQTDQNLRQNIFNLSDADRQLLLAAPRSIALERGLDLSGLLAATTATISGTGNAALTVDLVDISSQFSRSAEAIKEISGGLGDIVTTAGLSSAKEALGFLTIVQANARAEDISKTAPNLGRVLSLFTAETTGSDARTGGALLSAITKGSADKEARLSRTGAVNLVQKAKDFFSRGDVSTLFDDSEIDTFNEQLAILFSNKQLGREFVTNTSFEAGVRGGITKLILGDKIVRGAFDETFSQLGNSQNRISAAERGIDFVNRGELQNTSRVEGTISAATESFRISTKAEISQEGEAKLLQLAAKATGRGFIPTRFNSFLVAGSTFSREEALSFAESRAAIGRQGFAGSIFSDEELPAERREAVKSLELIAQSLRESIAIQQEQLAETKRNSELRPSSGRGK